MGSGAGSRAGAGAPSGAALAPSGISENGNGSEGINEYEYRMPKSGAETAAEEKLIAGQLQTAAALFNMAFVLRQQGKHEEALELYQRCMRIR